MPGGRWHFQHGPIDIVIDAEPFPPPEQPPELVITTGAPEPPPVAATVKDPPYTAETGAADVTEIDWDAWLDAGVTALAGAAAAPAPWLFTADTRNT